MKRTLKVLALSIAAGLMSPLTPLHAQESENSKSMLEEVLVTARKREESLQDIPVSLSVFDAGDIQAADLKNLQDVSNLTPGFQFFSQGNQQPGRYNTQLQFRGLTTAQFSPSFATGALFIDGIYVLNGGTSIGLMDVERVEVIKGPQSAYFGRNTFGGAVNIITRDPSLDEFHGEVMGRMTSESNNEYNAFIEGPILEDKLSFSLSARYYDKEGQWKATDGGTMGDEQTTTFNGVLNFQPNDNVQIKARYAYSEDDDGGPAQGFISGILNDTCTGKTVNSAEGPVMPVRYICGKVPYGNAVVTDPGFKVISSNTKLPQYVIDRGLTNPDTNLDGVPQVNDIGLKRETERFSLFGSWDIGGSGYTLDGSYGSNKQDANWIRDFDLSDRINWFSRDPQSMDDDSYEIRFSSPGDDRLRWLVGYNSYSQKFTSSGGGGDASTSCFNTSPTLIDNYPSGCIGGRPGILTLLFPNSRADSDRADVEGIFGAIDYDITDKWTATLEGRWQSDKITKGAGLNSPGAPLLTETFDDFLPRVILRYTPTETTNVYIQYSEGQLAGDFNTFYINADEREKAQYNALDPRISDSLDAETLEAWEIGWKQGFAEGRGQVNLSAYYYTWENIKGRSSFLINETCRAGDIGNDAACNPANGQMVGDPKAIIDPSTGELVPFFNSRNILLPGDATIKGVELETWYFFTESLQWTLNMSYIDSKYDDYEFNFVKPFAGFAQMSGNQTPRQPKWSGNTSLTYFFNMFDQAAYIRGDWIYQGKSYVDESNLAYISSYSLVNGRLGLDMDSWLVELFVTNLFDEEAWQTGARWTDFGSPTQFAYFTAKQGVAVSPLDKREFGARVSWRF
jgi:iron complex outermembrane receptor protein